MAISARGFVATAVFEALCWSFAISLPASAQEEIRCEATIHLRDGKALAVESIQSRGVVFYGTLDGEECWFRPKDMQELVAVSKGTFQITTREGRTVLLTDSKTRADGVVNRDMRVRYRYYSRASDAIVLKSRYIDPRTIQRIVFQRNVGTFKGCPKCGGTHPERFQFCPYCKSKLIWTNTLNLSPGTAPNATEGKTDARKVSKEHGGRPHLPADLARLAKMWGNLPKRTRNAILTLAEAARGTSWRDARQQGSVQVTRAHKPTVAPDKGKSLSSFVPRGAASAPRKTLHWLSRLLALATALQGRWNGSF